MFNWHDGTNDTADVLNIVFKSNKIVVAIFAVHRKFKNRLKVLICVVRKANKTCS